MINRHRSQLEHLDEIDAALATEIAANAERLCTLNSARQRTLADVLVTDPAFMRLVDEVPAAWAHLRTMRGALEAVDQALGVEFPDSLRPTYQRVEPLELNALLPATPGRPEGGVVRMLALVAADRALIERRREAVARLRDDADAELPEVKR